MIEARNQPGGSKRGAPLFVGSFVLALFGALASAACGDDGNGALLGASHASQPQPGPAATVQPPAGDTLPDGGPLTEAGALQARGERMFRALEADLVGGCGGTGGVCHVNGFYENNQTPKYLAPPDAYASIKAYPGIIVGDPYGSKLIVKGPHAGPAFTGNYKDLGDRVLAWLTVEAAAIKATPLPSTQPFQVKDGDNEVAIDGVATGVDGAKITFRASQANGILTLTDVQLVSPAATGVHVAHPIFATVDPGGAVTPDPVDSFSNLDQTQAAGQKLPLGAGTLILTGWDPKNQMAIEFTTLAAAQVSADAGAGAGGCKSLQTFTANAVPAIQNNQCLNCHDTGGSGNGSLDLSQVGKNEAAACAQALTKVNKGNKAQSPILTAPTGGVAAHPFKGASQQYTQMMLNWINNE